jgi:oligopeptide/dipeptide ABC transporter ATP-binding protein
MTALSLLRLVPRPGRIEAGAAVQLLGRNLLDLPVPQMRRVRGHEISMIFQEPMTSLNPVTAVGKQVVEAISLHEAVSNDEARERTLQLFRRVGIPDPEQRFFAYPHQLSGGLKQRVMIAMALSTRPKLLIADEPTTALDVTIQAQILELLRELQRDLKMAILLITHDLAVVNELADEICVMYAGRIIERGTRLEVLSGARHPYTLGLLASMPARASRGRRLAEIDGVVPPPSQWPRGCRFCTRCPRAFEPCPELVPGPTVLSETHSVHCHAVERDLGR